MMQINFTELKFEMIASQWINALQSVNDYITKN